MTVAGCCGRYKIMQASSHSCQLAIVLAWLSLLLELLPLNGGQAEKSSLDGCYRFGTLESRIVVPVVGSCAVQKYPILFVALVTYLCLDQLLQPHLLLRMGVLACMCTGLFPCLLDALCRHCKVQSRADTGFAALRTSGICRQKGLVPVPKSSG